jgi:predicted permease
MENIYLGIRVIFPLLVFVTIGFSLRRLKWFTVKTFDELNKVVFRVFMPMMLFLNVNMESVGEVFSKQNVQALIIGVACILFTFIVASLAYRHIERDKERRAVLVQGTYRSNLLLFGIPINTMIYGEGNLGAVAVFVIVVVPLYNIVSAVLLQSATSKVGLRSAFKSTYTNPLVIGAVSGILFNLSGASMPGLFYFPVEQLGRIGIPLAFIVLGGSLQFYRLKEEWKHLLSISVIRLILSPILAFTIARIMGLSGAPLTALVVLTAAPIAVAAYTMAKNENVAPDLAGDLVATTTLLSMVTMSVWITLLGFWGLL